MKLSCIIKAKVNQTLSESVGDLILRIFVGLTMAFGHGWGKLPPSEKFVEGVTEMGFPMPSFFAWCAAAAEFFGGILIAAGLLTRPAAASVAVTMIIAGFIRHAADPFKVKELALIYLATSFYYMLSGAGRFSADAVLSRRLD